jgi:hypothetical protein
MSRIWQIQLRLELDKKLPFWKAVDSTERKVTRTQAQEMREFFAELRPDQHETLAEMFPGEVAQ